MKIMSLLCRWANSVLSHWKVANKWDRELTGIWLIGEIKEFMKLYKKTKK